MFSPGYSLHILVETHFFCFRSLFRLSRIHIHIGGLYYNAVQCCIFFLFLTKLLLQGHMLVSSHLRRVFKYVMSIQIFPRVPILGGVGLKPRWGGNSVCYHVKLGHLSCQTFEAPEFLKGPCISILFYLQVKWVAYCISYKSISNDTQSTGVYVRPTSHGFFLDRTEIT